MKDYLFEEMVEFESFHWWYTSKRTIVMDIISRKCKLTADSSEILEVGSGPGVNLDMLGTFGHVTALEPNKHALNYLQKKEKLKIVEGSLPSFDIFPKESFDMVIALDMIEHVEDDLACLKSISYYLKKDGCVVITVPAFQFLWSAHDDDNDHKRRYTKNQLAVLFEKADLKVEFLSYYNSFLFPVSLVLRSFGRFYKKSAKVGLGKPSPIVNYVLKIIFTSEKYFLRYLSFPFGLSLIAVVKKKS